MSRYTVQKRDSLSYDSTRYLLQFDGRDVALFYGEHMAHEMARQLNAGALAILAAPEIVDPRTLARARYSIVGNDAGALILRDVGPWSQYPTITNDAGAVVHDLVRVGALLPTQRLFYFDSDENLDEILVNAGTFAGFAPCARRRVL